MKRRARRSLGPMLLAATLIAAASAAACPDPTERSQREDPVTGGEQLLPIPQARVPLDGVLSGGQPTADHIAAAARGGYRTVVNLRAEGEAGFEWERAAVESHGMRYVHIPIAGAEDLTRANVELVDAALREARDRGAVILHCGSGNRIGAVLALRAAWLEGADPQAALDHGLASGLTRLEPATREILGLEGAADE